MVGSDFLYVEAGGLPFSAVQSYVQSLSRILLGLWRKRVGVEPTIRLAKSRITGFEGREDHRTLCASGKSIQANLLMNEMRTPGVKTLNNPLVFGAAEAVPSQVRRGINREQAGCLRYEKQRSLLRAGSK